MIQPYSQHHLPPAPILDLFVSLPDRHDWYGPYVALVDTGADFTIVPLSIMRSLQARALTRITLSSQWHERHPLFLFKVDLRITGRVWPATDVAGDPNSDEVILGRNVLNRLDLRLEGPKLRTHILEG